jgi:hypothetical protein
VSVLVVDKLPSLYLRALVNALDHEYWFMWWRQNQSRFPRVVMRRDYTHHELAFQVCREAMRQARWREHAEKRSR